jgi:hypothetical protein
MEATGVYWKPVSHVLEESFELVLASAQHVKNVPKLVDLYRGRLKAPRKDLLEASESRSRT